MKPVFASRRRRAGFRSLVLAGVLLMSVASQACDSDEMIAQMRSACTEMVAGYQKALGQQLASPAAQSAIAQARAHCQALEFDKAGLKLALAARPAKVVN
ncbi:hypothetical protein [Polaromonas sp.]|uniref:hypothetical protein n=1 Tax=Polaromonas sp. TaxID=1869339 RepID=UPI002FCA41BE